MTEQQYIAREDPPFDKMTRDEILAFFDWYDFKDSQDHRLSMCYDFIRLVELVAVRQSTQ